MTEFNFRSLGPFFWYGGAGNYLVHHIDECLGVVPIKVLNHLNFVAVRENVCDQGDLLVRSERKFNRALPCWNTAACEKQVSPVCGSGVGTHKPNEIRNGRGRILGSLFQHCCINDHLSSVKAGWAGRGGRTPLATANLAA